MTNPLEQAPTTFAISEAVTHFSISPAEFLASRPDIHNLIAGAMIFRSTPDSLETLLLQRAPSDSFPLKWEIPAGTTEPSIDLSIAGTAVRELWEETQLRARRLRRSVGLGLPNGVTNLALTGEAEDARMDSELDLCLLRVSSLTWAIVTFITDVEDGPLDVVLRPDEHIAWTWVDEHEVKKGQFRRETGKGFEFVSEAMRMTVLEGFRLWKEMA
ncbi:hypothetical protein ACHAPT_011872 [Fusarium lateritium]